MQPPFLFTLLWGGWKGLYSNFAFLTVFCTALLLVVVVLVSIVKFYEMVVSFVPYFTHIAL